MNHTRGDCTLCAVLGEFTRATVPHPEWRRLCDRCNEAVLESQRNRTKNRGVLSEMNVVPYIDVMLVLLVIFMITAPLLSQGIVVDLPDVAADPLTNALDDPLVLSVDQDGQFYMNFGGDEQAPLDEQTVLDRASGVVRRRADTPIFVRGDEGATHGRVMRGFGLLRQAGASQVVLVTDLPESEERATPPLNQPNPLTPRDKTHPLA